MNKKMRKPIIAGNWKMYKTRDEALSFLFAVNEMVPSINEVESVLFTPSILLSALVKREGDNLRIGAQNMHFEVEGAYTGEISAAMLKSVGVEYTLIGHSERRTYYNETDEAVNLKVIAALKNEITPIICVGEELKIREKGTTNKFVSKQVKRAYENVSAEDAIKTVVAYEPIWAIGTGKVATPEQANETIQTIRKVLTKLYGKITSRKIRILYGGSVKPSNIDEILSESDIDGVLVGGASLDPESYLALVKAALK